jgi:very-short-patch-repair endonuclease
VQALRRRRNIVNNAKPAPARAALKSMTRAEACLWKYGLRAGQIKRYVFERQSPVMSYVVDFLCKPLRLIIEVDGSGHADPEAGKHAAARQRELDTSGFTVLRFRDEDILRDMDEVRTKISSAIVSLEKKGHKQDSKPLARHSL